MIHENTPLRDCPFCGGSVYVQETETTYAADCSVKIRCSLCGTEFTLYKGYPFAGPFLIHLWNNRPDVVDSEELERLEAENEQLKAKIEELERMSLF